MNFDRTDMYLHGVDETSPHLDSFGDKLCKNSSGPCILRIKSPLKLVLDGKMNSIVMFKSENFEAAPLRPIYLP